MKALRSFFELEKYNTSISREVIAGLTTFTTMSYIVVVNPAILSHAGIPAAPKFHGNHCGGGFRLYPDGLSGQPAVCHRSLHG